MAEKENMNFEQSMLRLEEILNALEKDDGPLESSMSLFAEGSALIKQCTSMLDEADTMIKMLSVTDEGELWGSDLLLEDQ